MFTSSNKASPTIKNKKAPIAEKKKESANINKFAIISYICIIQSINCYNSNASYIYYNYVLASNCYMCYIDCSYDLINKTVGV